jgi:hypothetical protein
MPDLVDRCARMEPVTLVPAWSATVNSILPGPAGIHLIFPVSWSNTWGSPQLQVKPLTHTPGYALAS